jgi:hypothetical protein
MERAISRAVTFGPNAKSNRMDGAMAREQASCYGVNLAVGGGFGGGRTTSQNGTGCFAPLLSDRRHQSNRMDGAMAREQTSCCGVNLAAGPAGGWVFYACASVIFTKRLQTGEYRLRAHVLTGEIDLE